jgi:hypothetical protein
MAAASADEVPFEAASLVVSIVATAMLTVAASADVEMATAVGGERPPVKQRV